MSYEITLNRALSLAHGVSNYCKKQYPEILDDGNFHDWDYLTSLCKKLGAYLILDKALPGGSKRAAVMYVLNRPFIMIDKAIESGSIKASLSLAHELGHILMNHKNRFNFRAMGYSQPKNANENGLQDRYQSEIELEAFIASMLIMIPDGYMDKLIERHIFIPTKQLAETLELPLKWFAVRVQIYRYRYGYLRSIELLKLRFNQQFEANEDLFKRIIYHKEYIIRNYIRELL